jgi:hypothetical protein
MNVALHRASVRAAVAAGVCFLAASCSSPVPQAIYGVKPAVSGTPQEASSLLVPLEVDIELASEFVRNGYGGEFGRKFESYDFRTPGLRTVQAQQLIRLLKQYRSFRGEQVASALGSFQGRVTSVAFGRELSPVLYIELPHWTHQRELSPPGAERRRIGDEENERLVRELKSKLVGELGATEFGFVGGDSRHVRVWWH